MIKPEIPSNEAERLRELDACAILDTLSEKEYDDLTGIAAQICATPIALVSLVDGTRQWFKSHHGIDASETPREHAFCAHAINAPGQLFEVSDSRKDIRFSDNPLVTGEPRVIFYAGVPLVTEGGHALGTICVIDHMPKSLTEGQIKALSALSGQVMCLLTLRKKKLELQESLKGLQEKNEVLEQFASRAAHDIKSPLNNIKSCVELLQGELKGVISSEMQGFLGILEKSTDTLRGLIDGLLLHSRSDRWAEEDKEQIEVPSFLDDIAGLFRNADDVNIEIDTDLERASIHTVALKQVLINLISNAQKYGDKPVTEIRVAWREEGLQYIISVEDNGPGIAEADIKKIFVIFERLISRDRYGVPGNGIGLATVKKVMDKLGGSIEVRSEVGKGTAFILHFPK
ncbi:MAG: GAF domain-containing sensor histidine kinase [Planctomycetes bacterium]|nr:GAF domain-containing sensor histidine kinase [Planctomycetota bacterium]